MRETEIERKRKRETERETDRLKERLTFFCIVESHDVMYQNRGQVEEEETGDRFVSINFVLQVLPELQAGHVLVDQDAEHGLDLFERKR